MTSTFLKMSCGALIGSIGVLLSGCIAGYYAAAPAGFGGDFVLAGDGARLEACDLGPGIWSGNTPATCIHAGRQPCRACVPLPPGTAVKVVHMFVTAEGAQDVSIEVGADRSRQIVHAFRDWDPLRQILVRP